MTPVLQLLGNKQHIRALLIDRVLLQHEVRAHVQRLSGGVHAACAEVL